MKTEGIKNLTISEAEEQIESSKEELLSLRFQLAAGQLEEATRIHTVRKAITRLKAVAREREIEQSEANQ